MVDEFRDPSMPTSFPETTPDYSAPGYRAAAPLPPPRVVEEREEVIAAPLDRPRFSVAAGFYGWAVAMWFTLLFTGIILAFLGNAAYHNSTINGNSVSISQPVLSNLTTGGIVGGIVALFLAYFLGGFAAGRIGRWNGAWHGVAVVAWTVVFGILGAVLGNVAAANANVGAYFTTYHVDWATVTTNTIVTLAVMFVVALAGAVVGGMLGDNLYAEDRTVERRSTTMRRGRPL